MKKVYALFALILLLAVEPAWAQFSVSDGKPVLPATVTQAGLMSGRGVFADPKSLTPPQHNGIKNVNIQVTCIGPEFDDGSHHFCNDLNFQTDGYGNPDPNTLVPAHDNVSVLDGDSGSFRLTCNFVGAKFVDPIVFPQNKGGISHAHGFYGNYNVTPYSTHASLLANSESSCVGGSLNASGYWFPMLVGECVPGSTNGCAAIFAKYGYKNGHMFGPQVNIYYKCETATDCDHSSFGGTVYMGSISGQVLTVTSIISGPPLQVNDRVKLSTNSGDAVRVEIASFGTGTGGVGTYNITAYNSGSNSYASQVMNTGAPEQWPPAGLKMIAGDASATTPAGGDGSIYDWGCFNHAGATALYDHIPNAADIAAIGSCSTTTLTFNQPGDYGDLKLRIHFPNCWDGVNLDSAGHHNAHMAYMPFYNGCPAAFPKYINNIELQLHWQVPDDVIPFLRLASDPPGASGQPAGYSIHADYLEAWQQNTPQAVLGGKSIEHVIQANCYKMGYAAAHNGVPQHADCHDDLIGNPDDANPTHWLWMQ